MAGVPLGRADAVQAKALAGILTHPVGGPRRIQLQDDMYRGGYFWELVAGVQLFFLAFNLLEALLPSLISKESPSDR